MALYALALLAAGVAIGLRVAPQHPSVAEWREQEERFRRLNKNVHGHYDRPANSRELRWSVWPRHGATPRDRELFEAEAIHASRLLRSALRLSEDKFVARFGTNEVDQWLTAIRALVHPGTDMVTAGRDAGGQRTAGHFIEELPVMSANACVKLAAGVRPRLGLPSDLA